MNSGGDRDGFDERFEFGRPPDGRVERAASPYAGRKSGGISNARFPPDGVATRPHPQKGIEARFEPAFPDWGKRPRLPGDAAAGFPANALVRQPRSKALPLSEGCSPRRTLVSGQGPLRYYAPGSISTGLRSRTPNLRRGEPDDERVRDTCEPGDAPDRRLLRRRLEPRPMRYGPSRFVPGLLLCVSVTVLASALQSIETRVAGEPYLEALVLAILLGVCVRTVWTPGPLWTPGIGFSAKILLEVAVVLLGASVSAATVLALGPLLIGGIALVVAVAILVSYAIGRACRLPQRMAILIACGNSICGNSAIAAVAPVIGAAGDEVASSIAFTAVLGVVVVLVLPLLVPVLRLSLTQYGVLAGLTVYAVPQVLAATLPIGALSNQVGTVVKLVRVLMLGPAVLGLSLLTGVLRQETAEAAPAGDRPQRGRPALHELVPWFIVGFLVVLAVRSLGLIPTAALPRVAAIASALTTVSMAALGLGVDVRVVAAAGLRVTGVVTASLVVLGLISLGLIRLIGVG